ncbi:MAG: hypothetical protein M3Z54_02715 [Gemmatimonadota bacterium]|nr:hypothetical protein [Gemmatimonadota bacterium]
MSLAEERIAHLATGDVRWSAGLKLSEAWPERVPLVVLSDPWMEAGTAWVDVAPIGTNLDVATITDFVLSRSHSSISLAWRISFAFQTVVAASSLGELLDRLTPTGVAEIQRAMAGDVNPQDFGSLAEESGDETAHVGSLADYMRLLGRSYALTLDEPAQAEAPRRESKRYVMRTKQQAPHPREQLKFAAASHGLRPSETEYCAQVDEQTVFCGKLIRQPRSAEVSFIIDSVDRSHLNDRKWVLLLSHKRLDIPNPLPTEPFVPSLSLRLVFKGILLREVNKLELAAADVSRSD